MEVVYLNWIGHLSTGKVVNLRRELQQEEFLSRNMKASK